MKRREAEEEGVRADVLPVLNIMFLLIPALLLAMEVASMSQIAVASPSMCRNCGDPGPDDPSKQLRYRVHIAEDGYFTRVDDAKPDERGPDIPTLEGAHDFAALEAQAEALKARSPKVATVTISADAEVTMDVLVETMDALRGDSCQLDDLERAGCLFWNPVIQSGTAV